MFDWLFEGWPEIYIPLASILLILLALWWRDRNRRWLYGAGAVAALLALYFVLDLAVETSSEQIKRKLHEMARAVQKKDTKAIFTHVSDQFTWDDLAGMKKAQFELLADRLIQSGTVTELVIMDEKLPDRTGRVDFVAKPKGPNIPDAQMVRVKALFVRDADGQWRLKSFTLHDYLKGDRIEVGRLLDAAKGLP
jgi:hypothetical protein